MTQRSLFDALEPIDPYGYVDRLPGCDAPCICREEGGRPEGVAVADSQSGDHDPLPVASCKWPFCPWPDHQPTQEDA